MAYAYVAMLNHPPLRTPLLADIHCASPSDFVPACCKFLVVAVLKQPNCGGEPPYRRAGGVCTPAYSLEGVQGEVTPHQGGPAMTMENF